MSPKVTSFLWFNDQADEAAEFYVSLFEDAEIFDRSVDDQGQTRGISFRLGTSEYTAFNGGPYFQPTPAFSFYVDCADQAEVDRLWRSLSENGEEGQCGWLTDRFGLSWQIIPSLLPQLLNDPKTSEQAMDAMLKMKKIDIETLLDATKEPDYISPTD